MYNTNVSDEKHENLQTSVDSASWYVAYTQPKSEKLAVENLDRQGFQTYCPQYKAIKKKKSVGSACLFEVMFPRYVFFRPCTERLSISVARSTRGVSFVLSFGVKPALLKNAELLALKKFEEQQNQYDLVAISPFRPHTKVRLLDQSLHGLEGLVHSVSGKRVWVLLEFLGRQNLVSVDHSQLQLAWCRLSVNETFSEVPSQGFLISLSGVCEQRFIRILLQFYVEPAAKFLQYLEYFRTVFLSEE